MIRSVTAKELLKDLLNPDGDDGYEWLELDPLPTSLTNPLDKYDLDGPDYIEEAVRFMMEPEYLHFICERVLNVRLAPYQMAILDTLWKKKMPLMVATRGGAKTFLLGVYVSLRLLLNPGCKVAVVGAALRQSRLVFDYINDNIYSKAPIFQDIVRGNGGPKREVDRFEFRVGDSIAIFIPLGNGEKIRGLRANYLVVDEISSISAEIFNVVVRGFGVVSKDPIERMKYKAKKRKLVKLGLWNEAMDKGEAETFGANQIIISGTASFHFNLFYKMYKTYRDIIASRGRLADLEDILGDDKFLQKGLSWEDCAIIQLPYNHMPEGMQEENMIAQAKAAMPFNQFMMEYGAKFAIDTEGFFKRSVLESATTTVPIVINGQRVQFSAAKFGNVHRKYVIGIDPAAERDNAAIVVLEVHPDHTRIVYCWTVNRKKFLRLKKAGLADKDDYFKYIARKVRNLMAKFPTEAVVIDKNGGGIPIIEALANEANLEPNEAPIYEIIDDIPKWSDDKQGLHIVHAISPNNDYNQAANHGMLKDLQDRRLLFPMFDSVEIERQLIKEGQSGPNDDDDVYEDVVFEIEELKTEITTIVCSPTATGKENFDTPEIKSEVPGMRKGHLVKDRYSALLYANNYIREKIYKPAQVVVYKTIGTSRQLAHQKLHSQRNSGQMYTGPGMEKVKQAGGNLSKVGFVKRRP